MKKKNIKTHSKKKKAKQFYEKQQYPQALELYLKVTEIDPRDADAFYMAGVLSGLSGRQAESIGLLEKSIELRPGHALCHYNLGISYRETGNLHGAAEMFNRTIRLKPDYGEAYNALAHILIALKKNDEAVDYFNKLIQLEPKVPQNKNNLGTVLQGMGKLNEAIECYQSAIDLNPDLTIVWDSLGSAFTGCGRFDEAIEAYRKSLAIDPSNMRGRSNLLLTLNYMENISQQVIYDEHRQWASQHCKQKPVKLNVDIESKRKFKVAYISPDFRAHSVAYFIEPLLKHHNREKFEIYAYSSVPQADATTERLKQLTDHWRDISKQTVAKTVEQIKKDGIDILVDLSGHTAGNHLEVFCYKPAPVQVTWLGYPNTTGLDVMDYRLVDAITDPQGSEQYCSETLVRLPGCFLSYLPMDSVPDVAPLPYDKNGYITFGSFNNLSKMGETVVDLWCELLKFSPDARLLIKNPSLTDEKTRNNFRAKFISRGVSAERLELTGHTASRKEHLELYGRIDIALDTFPYNGTTTSCEALWMGVPVVAILGNSHVSRVSASLLKNIGLDQLVADNADNYLSVISCLTEDIDLLREMRSTMRRRMTESVLCNYTSFADNIENAYTDMWSAFCKK